VETNYKDKKPFPKNVERNFEPIFSFRTNAKTHFKGKKVFPQNVFISYKPNYYFPKMWRLIIKTKNHFPRMWSVISIHIFISHKCGDTLWRQRGISP